MSDEPTPPPLRLKPRIRSTPDTPVPAPTVPQPENASAASAPAASAEAPKLRLKPKLSADPVTPAASTPAEAPPAPASASVAEPPAVVPPAAPAPGPEVEAAEAPKFKLKMKPAAPAAEAAVFPSASPPVADAGGGAAPPVVPSSALPGSATDAAAKTSNTPTPFPVITNAPRGTKKYPPPVPHLRAPGKVEEPVAPPPPVRKRKAPASGRRVLALVGVVLVAGGYWGYLRLTAPEPPPPPPLIKPKATTAPGRAVEKAKEIVDAPRAAEQARIDELTDGGNSSGEKASEPAQPKTPPPAVVTTQIAPGVTASSASIDITGNAGLGFRTWLGNVRINGVFQGKTPRALVNGRAYRVGQTVDEPLGIVIAAIDAKAKTILFRDRTGATALHHY